MSEENAFLWDSIPRGQRSEIFKIAFGNWKNESVPKEKILLLQRLESLQQKLGELKERKDKAEAAHDWCEEDIILVQAELQKFDPDNLVTEEGKIYPDSLRFYNKFLEHAQKYLEDGTIFHSPSGQNRYRVHSIENKKVFIERMDSKSPKPSSFTYNTVRKAVRRLASDKPLLEVGEFMPVLAQECAVVEIHPNMNYLLGKICYMYPEVTE